MTDHAAPSRSVATRPGAPADPPSLAGPAPRLLLLFDGECAFCASSVSFVLDHERGPTTLFAPLQSAVGLRELERAGLPTNDLDTVVLIEDGKARVRSDAVIRIARELRWPWRALGLLALIPRFIRDAGYRAVAKRRHAISQQCRMPRPFDRSRVLHDPTII